MLKEPANINKDEQDILYARIPTVFSPGTPISNKQLFAGRREQVVQVLESIYHPGQHVIIFGDRGIGKTSLSAVLGGFATGADSFLLCRINCGADDTFDSVWRKMFTQIEVGDGDERKTIAELLGDTPITPFVVQQQLIPISHDKNVRIILVFDEFDTILDPSAKRSFSETIKALSDFAVPATIIIVGIADTVDKLIAEHQSIERNIVQVRMPRMSAIELEEILVKNGLDAIGLGIEDNAMRWIIELSQGLPNYTHSLGKYAALAAVGELKRNVLLSHVVDAITKAHEQTNHTIRSMYVKAVSCPRRNILKEVLLACAMARTDELGAFAANDVREPLRKIMNDESYDIPNYAAHLNAFSSTRGPVLLKTGTKKNYRYRFVEPVLAPYIRMDGYRTGMLKIS